MLTWKDMETLYERLEADDCIGVYIEIKQYAQHYLKDRQECQKAVEILDQMLSVMDPCICGWKCNTETPTESGITAADCFVHKIE